MLNEKLNLFGILGCILCITGSIVIVMHAPEERDIHSLLQIWTMALQPGTPAVALEVMQHSLVMAQHSLGAGFMLYFLAATAVILYLIIYAAPKHGTETVFVFIGICSLVGSLSVMSVKARPLHTVSCLREALQERVHD